MIIKFSKLKIVILSVICFVSFGLFTQSMIQAQCPVDNRLVRMPSSDEKYYLPKNYVFKVKFDAPISTDTFKTGSIVQFSVIENVFGIKMPKFNKENENENEASFKILKEQLDKIMEDFEIEMNKILQNYKSETNLTLKSDNKSGDKNKALETSNKNKIKELETLYTAQAKEIENLFKPVRDELIAKANKDYDDAVTKVKQDFQQEIDAISANDPIRYFKIEKLQEEKVKNLEALKKEYEQNVNNVKKIPEVVIVIPKDSKGFGKVEKSKRQLPLFLNFKARISVVLNYVLLNNGDCIPIEVKDSPYSLLYSVDDRDFGNVKDCKTEGLNGKKCIKGRRPQYKFITPIISGIAAVAAILLDDPTSQTLAGFTAADQLTKDDLGNFINGADATVSDKLIYEVATTENRVGTIKAEEKK